MGIRLRVVENRGKKMSEMKILRNKKRTILAALALFFAFLMIGPFLPVFAANNAKIDAPGDEWNGEIPEITLEQNDKTPEDVNSDKKQDSDSTVSDEAKEVVSQEPAQTEVVVEKVVTNIIPPATTSRSTAAAPVATDAVLEDIAQTNDKDTTEEVTNEEPVDASLKSKFNMEVIELLEAPDSEQEEILIPETGNLDRNKTLDRAKRIGLMALSASGIVFFTGVMVWAAWKLHRN